MSIVGGMRSYADEPEFLTTIGRERLAQWIERSKLQQIEAAERIGMDATQLSQILAGKRRPGLDNAVKIYNVTGIVPQDWVPITEDENADESVAVARKQRIGKA